MCPLILQVSVHRPEGSGLHSLRSPHLLLPAVDVHSISIIFERAGIIVTPYPPSAMLPWHWNPKVAHTRPALMQHTPFASSHDSDTTMKFIPEDTCEPNTRQLFNSHNSFGVVHAVCKQDGGQDGVPYRSIGMSTRGNHRDYLTHWSRSIVVHKTGTRCLGINTLRKNTWLSTRETRGRDVSRR